MSNTLTDTIANLRADVDDMAHMLEEYLAFARGDSGEETERVDIRAMINDIVDNIVGKPASRGLFG